MSDKFFDRSGQIDILLDMANRTVPASTPWFVFDVLSGGSLLGDPSSGYLAFDAQGRLYLSDSNFLNDRIHRYDPGAGGFVRFTPTGVQEARAPRSIAFGADGALSVAAGFDPSHAG